MGSLYESYIEEFPTNENTVNTIKPVEHDSLFSNYQPEDIKVLPSTGKTKINVVKNAPVPVNINRPISLAPNQFEPKQLPQSGFIPMFQRLGTGLYEGIKALPSALVDFTRQGIEAGKTEFSDGYNPLLAYGALNLGAMQGAGNLVDGIWNLAGDLTNTYYGYPKVKPTFPLTQGVPNLINKTNFGNQYLQNAQTLMDRYPLTTMLSQELGEEIPAMLVGATTAKYGLKAGKLSKTADKLSDVGYKKLATHSAVSGFGEGFISEPAQNQAFNMSPEERIKNRFINAGSGAVIAPALNIGTKATIENVPKIYNKVREVTPKAINTIKDVNAKIINFGNENFTSKSAFDDLKAIKNELSSNRQVKNSLYKNYDTNFTDKVTGEATNSKLEQSPNNNELTNSSQHVTNVITELLDGEPERVLPQKTYTNSSNLKDDIAKEFERDVLNDLLDNKQRDLERAVYQNNTEEISEINNIINGIKELSNSQDIGKAKIYQNIASAFLNKDAEKLIYIYSSDWSDATYNMFKKYANMELDNNNNGIDEILKWAGINPDEWYSLRKQAEEKKEKLSKSKSKSKKNQSSTDKKQQKSEELGAKDYARELLKGNLESQNKYLKSLEKSSTPDLKEIDYTKNYIKQLEKTINSDNFVVTEFHNNFIDYIKNKKVEPLLAVIGQANGLNTVSKNFFSRFTGVKLPKTKKGIENAILEWAGYNPDEWRQQKIVKENQIKIEKETKAKNELLNNVIKDLSEKKVIHNGVEKTFKEMFDGLYNDGYQLSKYKKGIKPVYKLSKPAGNGVTYTYEFTKPFEKMYIDHVWGNKTNKAINTLEKSGVDVTRTDLPDLFSKDTNTNVYKVSENDNTSQILNQKELLQKAEEHDKINKKTDTNAQPLPPVLRGNVNKNVVKGNFNNKLEENTNERPIQATNGKRGRLPKTQTPKSKGDGKVQEREPRTSGTIHNIRRGNELHDNGRGLIPEHQEIISAKYKNQNELNNAIKDFIQKNEYKKYDGAIPLELKNWLKKYTGAGGLEKQGATGIGLLSEYYTPESIVKEMWELTKKNKNLNNAKILEPSAGIGRFLEYAPENVKLSAIEMDNISGTIAKILYPDVDIKITPFQERFIDRSKNLPVKNVAPEYDVIIGNPPYGKYSGVYKGLGEGKGINKLETYFIKRGLDLLNDDGILTFIVPSSFLESPNNVGKMSIAKMSTIVDAYRLPEKTFKTTDIGTDIIILKKNKNSSGISLFNNGEWFKKYPEKIRGEVYTKKDMYGKTVTAVRKHKNEAIEISTNSINKEYDTYTSDNKVDDYQLFADTRVDGTLDPDKYTVGEKINQYKGELYNDFNYLQGDIYEKLDKLATENISKEQKALQKKKLLSVLPKPKELNEMYLTPTSDFIKELSFGEIKRERYNYYKGANEIDIIPDTLDRRFLDYLKDISSSERNSLRLDYLERYVKGDELRIETYGEKEQKAQQRIEILTKIKNTVDKLFNDFINTKLSDNHKKILKDKWNRKYNNLYNPDYKKMPLLVKELSKTFYGKPLNLLPTQIEGINFVTNKGVGLIGFEVGVGKTLTGAIATVQQLQMGRCKRPLVLVPKQVKNNWIREFNQAFPNQKVNDLDNLSKLKKDKLEDGAINIATFEALSNIWYDEKLIHNEDGSITRTGEITKLIDKLYDVAQNSKRNETLRGAEKQKEDIKKIIGIAEKGNRKLFTINELGFDHITIDEAHNFRNLFRQAKAYGRDNNAYQSVGQGGDPSARAARLFLLVQHILDKNQNRNVFMLTATPFNNSPLEVFNMLSYLAKDRLDKMGLYNVYEFMENFASMDTEWVVKNNNDVKYEQVVKAFKNVSVLKSLIKSFMIIRSADDAGVVRPNKHVDRVTLEPSSEQLNLIAEFEEEALHSNDDGAILKQINMARQATLSPDIASKNYEVSANDFVKNAPKIEYVMKAVEQMKLKEPNTSQLIYMPLGKEFLPKLKEYLVNNKIYKPEEVEIISSDTKDNKITEITDSFNKKDGTVKLIIGTQKIKEGMNLNKNTSILYIPFIDWNPTDFVQICGRIWRQGNSYKDVKIVVPLLKNSSDPFMFQKLDEKTSRINNIMAENGDKDFIETGELNTAEEKISMITLPDKKAKMAVRIENQKIENEKSKIIGRKESVEYYQKKVKELKERIDYQKNNAIPDLQYDKNTKGHLYGDDYFDEKISSAKKMLTTLEKSLESLNARIERLELDFNGKDSIENLNKTLEELKLKQEELSKFEELKLEEYTKEYEEQQKNKISIDEHIRNFKKSIDELYGNENSDIEYSIGLYDRPLKPYEKTSKENFSEPRRKIETVSQKKSKQKAKEKLEKLKNIDNTKIYDKQVRHAIHRWYAEIEKRRYDVNKNLNLFVNDIKKIGKKLNINDKALRELMPFLRERTDLPEELNRPDLKKAWEKLSDKDKKFLTQKADNISQTFNKYWKEYKQANGYDENSSDLPNYISHIWDLDKKQKSLLTNYFSTRSKFSKERVIKTLMEGINGIKLDNGEIKKFTPKTLDYAEILKIHSDNLIKSTFNKLLAEQIKSLKTTDGLHLILPAHKAPINWIDINHPALNKIVAKPVASNFGEVVSPKLQNILTDLGIAIGRRLNPPKKGKGTYFEGKYVHGKPPEIRLQRWFSNKTLAHEIGHAIDKKLKLKESGFVSKYKKELLALNQERIDALANLGKKQYATKDSELIAELAGFVFNDTLRAYQYAPQATGEFIELLTKNDNLKQLLPQTFDWNNAKHVLEEKLIELFRVPVKVHPDIADTLKLVFENQGDKSEIGKVYDDINSVLKQFQLGFSGFHGWALTESALANLGVKKTAKILNPVKIFNSLLNNEWDIYKQDDIIKQAIDDGLQIGATLDINRSRVEHILDDTSKFIEQKVPFIGKSVSIPFKLLSKTQKINNQILWTHLHNMYKLETYKVLIQSEAQNGRMTDNKRREIAQWCNDSYGGQVWEDLGIKPSGRKWEQRLLRSPDWLRSTTRQFLGILSGEATDKFIKKLPDDNKFWEKAKVLSERWGITSITGDVTSAGMRGRLARRFWLHAFIQFSIYTNVLNAIFREKDRNENPDLYPTKMTPKDYSILGNSIGDKTYVFLGRNKDGTERYWRLGKQFREVPELVTKPTEKLGGKVAPVIDLLSQTFTSRTLSNFENRDLAEKKGFARIPALAKLYVNAILPFSFNSAINQSKDFSLYDFIAQTSKGTTFYKGREQYLHAIKNKDKKQIKAITNDLKRNKINPNNVFNSALKEYQKKQRSELFRQVIKERK